MLPIPHINAHYIGCNKMQRMRLVRVPFAIKLLKNTIIIKLNILNLINIDIVYSNIITLTRTKFTFSECFKKQTDSKVFKFQMRTVLSLLAEANKLFSKSTSKELTSPVWPRKLCKRNPVARFQILIKWSFPPLNFF